MAAWSHNNLLAFCPVEAVITAPAERDEGVDEEPLSRGEEEGGLSMANSSSSSSSSSQPPHPPLAVPADKGDADEAEAEAEHQSADASRCGGVHVLCDACP